MSVLDKAASSKTGLENLIKGTPLSVLETSTLATPYDTDMKPLPV